MTQPATPNSEPARALNALRRHRHGRAALTAILAAMACGLALAEPKVIVVDECVESSADLQLRSIADAGRIDIRLCETCGFTRLTLDADTRFLIGRTAVNFPDWLAAAKAAEAPVQLCFQPQTRVVTRLKVADPRKE